ncbi:MAG: site-specific DNA-methyltransferase [Desulfobaccales bacterium]
MAKEKKAGKRPIENYDHRDKERVNNPPVGLVTPELDKDAGKKVYAYDPHIDPALQFDSQGAAIEALIDRGLAAENQEGAKAVLAELQQRRQPYLNWAGKAERTTFAVPTLSLHVHERIDPRTILEAVRKRNGTQYRQPEQMPLFECREENPPLREAIQFYKHKHGWSNRLVAGDSLVVMNSLLEKEGLAGQVQMIYIDPPYGIKYGSNFQPFVNKREVKDGKDEDLTQEPEMIKAFRDTWELGIHSYLTYLRDRLWLAKELLTESGSVFVQMGDENAHLSRALLDDVFGIDNFISEIVFYKTSGKGGSYLDAVFDRLLWYAKDKASLKYFQLYMPKPSHTLEEQYTLLELSGGTVRNMTEDEIANINPVPERSRRFMPGDLSSQGKTESGSDPFAFDDVLYELPPNTHWKTTQEGLKRLKAAGRLYPAGKRLRYRRFAEDFPVSPFTNVWQDTVISGYAVKKIYTVETSPKVIERCILMTTDPGDIVVDPTCGSGTTAFAAEKWGRRWITCDTSRVAITLAKQRLMTALFDYYELAHPDEGVGSGFKYKTVPHITLKSIATNPEIREGMSREEIDAAIAKYADQETLYDQPQIDKSKARVSGPFTMEAVPAPVVKPLDEVEVEPGADETIARSGETLRQAEWRDELFHTGIRAKGGQKMEFSRMEPLPGTRWLQAEAETKGDNPQRVVISFGPEHAPLEQRQVALAIEEAQTLVPRPKIIVFAAFRFDPEAAKDIAETMWPGVTLLTAEMNMDLQTDDLKKKRASNESFWFIGQPDLRLTQTDTGKYQVEVLGFDYYNPKTGVVESGGVEKIAMWLLDPDYDGRSLYPRQVFFPMAGDKEGWARLANNLKAEIDPDLIEAYRGTVSLPFEAGDNKRIAVKIVDDRGIESLKVMGVE